MKDIFGRDEVDAVLEDNFYAPGPRSTTLGASSSRAARGVREVPRSKPTAKKKPKPDHYEVICISLYKEDLARLDDKVRALKGKGHRKMSRSALIRFALDTVDLDDLPRSY
jgi:hypothetical protein